MTPLDSGITFKGKSVFAISPDWIELSDFHFESERRLPTAKNAEISERLVFFRIGNLVYSKEVWNVRCEELGEACVVDFSGEFEAVVEGGGFHGLE